MQNRQRPEKLVSFMDVQVRVEYDRSNRVSTRTDNRPAHTAARPEEGQFLCRGPGPLPPPLAPGPPVIIMCINVSDDYHLHTPYSTDSNVASNYYVHYCFR